MKWSDDEYDSDRSSGSNSQMSAMITGMVFFTVALFGIVVYFNKESFGFSNKNRQEAAAAATTESDENNTDLEAYLSGDTKTASDLDIWDMYPEGTQSQTENDAMPAQKQESKTSEADPSTDGKHTKVTNRDGSTDWVTINNYLPKSTLDVTNLESQNNIMKYFTNGKQISYMGVDVSKYNSYVDYNSLKNAGVQYAMIRVGARGYQSGKISMDEYFTDNIKQAAQAGLSVGLTFYSQAVTSQEAQEEAQTVISSIGSYKITYPIAFDMEHVDNDTSRIDTLTADQKTAIAKTFCDAIKKAGYVPIIYGSKEWLIKEINLSKLTDYDVWLSQNEDVPDYPYKFAMWQYSNNGTIDGISGNADLDISLIDYTVK